MSHPEMTSEEVEKYYEQVQLDIEQIDEERTR